MGIARSRLIAWCFLKPSSALRSAETSPGSLPFAHWKFISPPRILSSAAAFFRSLLFWTPIQPQSSHIGSHFVSPSIKHLELLVITNSSSVWVCQSTTIIAASSATCAVPTAGGSLAEKLCVSSAGNHPPAPARAFSFLSSLQVPQTQICVITRSPLGGPSQTAGKHSSFPTSAKTLKPCVRPPQTVMSGLKVDMDPFSITSPSVGSSFSSSPE